MRRVLRSTLLPVCGLLAVGASACAPAGFRQPAVQGGGVADFLVGAWVREGDDCAGDAGVVYAADETFGAYDVSGTWSLERNRLLTLITERGEPDEPVLRVQPPQREVITIVSASDNRRTERWDDGSIHTYVRRPWPITSSDAGE
ncbi:MAG: hypothetical protein KY449_08575 [Proteobacteria bacterium]|nr:hypothetical protein [Pseudomonadota bacterium]